MTACPPALLFALLRHLSDGRVHSGVALATGFGVSRATVSNLLGQARAMGLAVHAVRGVGYRLPDAPVWLDAEAVRHALAPEAAGLVLQVRDCVDSTNRRLMADAGAAHGQVLVTEWQPEGRGRRGRRWQAPLGSGLTFSLSWRFETGLQTLQGLSLAVGVALARALRGLGVPVSLKWPNDLVARGRKLGGVLIEAEGDMDGTARVVIGVGLDVRLPAAFAATLGQPVTDLVQLGGTADRNRVLAACLSALHSGLAAFGREGFAAVRADWQALDAHAGRAVRLQLPDGGAVDGRACGVDETGALCLAVPGQGVQRFGAGEVSLRTLE